jgi:hypothetical protein
VKFSFPKFGLGSDRFHQHGFDACPIRCGKARVVGQHPRKNVIQGYIPSSNPRDFINDLVKFVLVPHRSDLQDGMKLAAHRPQLRMNDILQM